MNTVSAAGSAECVPCGADEYAPSGAIVCSPRPTCTEKDYTPVYGACEDGMRTRSYVWLNSTICDTRTGVLPESDTVPCAGCEPGTYRDSDSQEVRAVRACTPKAQ